MNKYEEIKEKYLKSNKYCLYIDYEDIGVLIHIIETLNQFNKQEVARNKELSNSYDKIYSNIRKIIDVLDEEQTTNIKDLSFYINSLNISKVDEIANKLSINRSIKQILKSLL